MARIVIPVTDEKGVDSQLSEHFGRAPYFSVFVVDDDGKVLAYKTVPNESEHFGGVGFPPDRILQLNPDAVITYGMGPRALARFQNAKVAVLRANASLARDLLLAYTRDKLEELTEGCHHAKHRL
jgi:predicted Fe-Mo cluster-binding NifX family protein